MILQKLKRFEDGFWYLQQNPFKNTYWARAAAKGFEIYWELKQPPESGLSYTGRLKINGRIVDKRTAVDIIEGRLQ